MIYRREGDVKILWVLVAALALVQMAFAFELLEMSSIMKRICSIDERTALIKQEAANKQLESENIRANYYRVLSTSPFKLIEEEARGIIKSGVRKEAEE